MKLEETKPHNVALDAMELGLNGSWFADLFELLAEVIPLVLKARDVAI